MIKIQDKTKIINAHESATIVIPKMFVKILNIQKGQPLYIHPNPDNTLTIQETQPTTKEYRKMKTRTLGGSHILTIPKQYAQQTKIKIGNTLHWHLNPENEKITIQQEETTQ